MSNNEMNNVFNKGLEMMKKGNFKEAESLFEKARNMTLETNKR